MSLFSLIFKFVHKYLNPKKFFLNLGKNFLKYIIFILPFILVFKTLYSCILNGVWDCQFFSQQFISNFPFIGKILYGIIWNEDSLLSIDIIIGPFLKYILRYYRYLNLK